MRASELRIGNYVYNETIREVMEVYPMMIPQIKKCELAGEHNIKPIPLTEEWLLKLGFENNQSGYYYIKLWHSMYLVVNNNTFYLSDTSGYDYYAKEIGKKEFVHQLQNLYFSLSGEELKEV